jgi:Cu/Ag efflux pump CusA
MVHAIMSWSLKSRLIVILAVLALVGAGVHSALRLNVEAFPDPTPPLVEIIAQNRGWSPEEMERLVAVSLETALNGMPGLEDLRSTSISGLTDINRQSSYGTNYWAARQEVVNRIGDVDLPQGVRARLSPWSPTGEIVRYFLEGPEHTTNQLKAIQDWVLNRELRRVPGVIDVTGYGGTVKQYQVVIDPRLLHQYNINLNQVEEAIDRSNENKGGDLLTMGTQSQLATISAHEPGASYIYRESNKRYIPIKFSVRGRNLASAINEAQRRVKDPRSGVQLPEAEGYRKLTGMPFSISAAVGFVSKFGVAVQNGVLLISYFNQKRGAGLSVSEAVVRGAELRLRPVVMTSLTAVLGLLPAALATPTGSQARKPLAIVVVGGMLVNMLLTQFLMPVLYTYFPG